LRRFRRVVILVDLMHDQDWLEGARFSECFSKWFRRKGPERCLDLTMNIRGYRA
jgi:hypothetical protein